MLELWYKYPCPICERDNFIHVEHWDDPEAQAVRCWFCTDICWLDIYNDNYDYSAEMELRAKIGVADPKTVIVVDGRPRPRHLKFRSNRF